MKLLNTLAQNRKTVALVATVILFVFVSITIAVSVLRKPSTEDFTAAKTLTSTVTKTQEALPDAANSYFAAYSRELNATGSAPQAKENAAKEYKAFTDAETSAREAIKQLVDSKAVNNNLVGKTIKQYASVTTSQTKFYSGMVNSYAEFKGLFGSSDATSCSGIFVGTTENLSNRKELLTKAAATCYPLIEALKKSENSSYGTYAFQIERRVKLLEQDADTIVKTEKLNEEYAKQLAPFEQRAADAKARNAPQQEVLDLLDEIKGLNVKVQDNQADFDFASKRYLATVRDFPVITESVFSTSIPAKLKHYTSLSEVRLTTLNLVLDDKLVE